jgi:CRP-like cAMP-binding protein
VDSEIEAVRELEDPLKQAQQASELLTRFQAAVNQLSRIRREAIEQLIAQGMTKAQLADTLGMTRARVGQLLAAGPRSEGLFLGNGTLTVALGGKQEADKSQPSRSSPRKASKPTSGCAS